MTLSPELLAMIADVPAATEKHGTEHDATRRLKLFLQWWKDTHPND